MGAHVRLEGLQYQRISHCRCLDGSNTLQNEFFLQQWECALQDRRLPDPLQSDVGERFETRQTILHDTATGIRNAENHGHLAARSCVWLWNPSELHVCRSSSTCHDGNHTKAALIIGSSN